jgi:NAD(P)-dependent dehydrogenase (short-subunit alcohol dehydrogenase family)
MAARGEGGALIAVSSVASRHAAPLMHGYAAAKAGISGLVRSVAAELAPRGIRANVLIPGFTENERLHPDTVSAEYDTEVVSSIPAGRWGTPDDIGAAAVYLADPALAYHTGAEVVVDGAYSIMPPYLAVRAARARANAGH